MFVRKFQVTETVVSFLGFIFFLHQNLPWCRAIVIFRFSKTLTLYSNPQWTWQWKKKLHTLELTLEKDIKSIIYSTSPKISTLNARTVWNRFERSLGHCIKFHGMNRMWLRIRSGLGDGWKIKRIKIISKSVELLIRMWRIERISGCLDDLMPKLSKSRTVKRRTEKLHKTFHSHL